MAETYFQQRMARLGVTPELNAVQIHGISEWEDMPDGTRQLATSNINEDQIFKPTDAGDIYITYLRLDGHYQKYKPDGNAFEKPFHRVRLSPEHETPDQKYFQPRESGTHIFLPPSIIEKYKAATKIHTLFAVEGEFKCYSGAIRGLDIVGLSGKDGFHLKKDKSLHPTILEIARVCNPDNICLLLDADVLQVNWEKWKRNTDYDLGERLNGFYNTVKTFREAARDVCKDVFFMHLNVDGDTKGLDDLFEKYPDSAEKIIEDLQKLSKAKIWFEGINLSAENNNTVRKHFYLNTNKFKAPETFYNLNQYRIGIEEFTFNGFRFKYNNHTEVLELVRHADSNHFIRVGCNYFKIIYKLKGNGRDLKRELIEWKAGEITRDYVIKGWTAFFDTIPKYNDFENRPANLPSEFRQEIDTPNGKLFNLYYPLEHEPKEGEWTSIKTYLEHIFGTRKLIELYSADLLREALNPKKSGEELTEEEESALQEKINTVTQLDIGLDYFTILYLKPWQKLPILSLVSQERKTGKSTMIDFMREIFGNNATSLGNDDINDIYNDDYAGKLVIGIEEALIEKQAVLEKLKNWCTNPTITMHGKFKGRRSINFYGHFIVSSNNEDNFIKIESDEVRFFVLKINSIKNMDTDMLAKMTEEIPQFLHSLLPEQRPMMFPKKDRLHFHTEIIKTEALKTVIENTKSYANKVITSFLKEEFLSTEVLELKITNKILKHNINDKYSSIKLNDGQIKNVMEKDLKLTPGKMQRFTYPVLKSFIDASGKMNVHVDHVTEWGDDKKPLVGTPYIIPIELVVPPEQFTDGIIKKIRERKELGNQTTMDLKEKPTEEGYQVDTESGPPMDEIKAEDDLPF